MQRLTVALVLVVVLSGATGCGDGTVLFGARTDFPAVSGTVSIVHLTIIDGNVQITAVTLVNSGSAQTLNFCGNVVSQFPTNTFVTVTFTQGSPCNTVMKVG